MEHLYDSKQKKKKRRRRGGGGREEKQPTTDHRTQPNLNLVGNKQKLSRRGALYTDAVGSQYVRLWRVKKGRKEKEKKRKKRTRAEERKEEKEERANDKSNHSTGLNLIQRF